MHKKQLEELLLNVQQNNLSIEDGLKQLETLPFSDLDFAVIDHHRSLRVGYPEVIYGQGKTKEQLLSIALHMNSKGSNVLITRVEETTYDFIKSSIPSASYNALGKVIRITNHELSETDSYIAIVSAGTSDLPVVEEAVETARAFGNKVERIVDVGVAGIHRLFNRLDTIRGAKVIIVIAGMEGALASVLAGLVDKPVIAVPTSVGYGANLGGVTALLSMVNSCASGVSVVNIDNGFGAAYSASMINHL